MATTSTHTIVHFCTYKNSTTKGWIKSKKEYSSMAALQQAMLPYLEKYPTTTVCYQTRTIYATEQP